MHLLDALARFETQLQADGRSPHTRGNYRRHVTALHAWLVAHGFDDDLDSIVPETLAAYLTAPETRESAHGGPRKTASLNAVRTSIRVFFAWTRDAGYARRNPAHLIRRALCAPPEPRALNDIEVQRLHDVLIAAQGPVVRRDHLLVHVLVATGIRIGSAIALDAEDVDLTTSTLHLRCAKGDRDERVFFGRDVRDHLVGYLAHKPRTGPLFRNPRGERWSKRSAQARISIWLERADIDGTPHSLRHTFATKLLRRTHDLFLVQRALHHRSIVSTSVYLSVDDSHLRAAVE
jgi:site-specific recombinase XerD